ncbi:MAG: hypothetical protein ACK4IT_01020 [Thioalkalivibrionaceae bacterium]
MNRQTEFVRSGFLTRRHPYAASATFSTTKIPANGDQSLENGRPTSRPKKPIKLKSRKLHLIHKTDGRETTKRKIHKLSGIKKEDFVISRNKMTTHPQAMDASSHQHCNQHFYRQGICDLRRHKRRGTSD